ncbi:MAG: exodeoxyribonuclease VII large subunit [Acidobacteriota bacterium]|nr:exodeoxyribonuclease VII large subunit [Acidobacteriota bacterium]
MARQLDLAFDAEKSARRIWPVHLLVEELRERVEAEWMDVLVEGEVSNLRPAPSGHLYFTLKDADAQLPVVLFRRQALLLRFRPAEGTHVLVRGRVSIYAQRGQLQLVGETVEPLGTGALQLAFEQLKEQLKAEGLFDTARKRALPAYPHRVAVVTSPTGAVIQDFLRIVERRHSRLQVVLYPVTVQGESAPGEIEQALHDLNEMEGVDLVVLARGGGSLEDLAAFNSERVARAIAASRLPIVSAIGHETDFTISDFVADLRAATPSAAAELVTAQLHGVEERLAELVNRLDRAVRFHMLRFNRQLDALAAEGVEWKVTSQIHRSTQRLDDLCMRMEMTTRQRLRQLTREVEAGAAAVQQHDPRQRLVSMQLRLAAAGDRLRRAQERRLQASQMQCGALEARLQSLSPLAVLQRGYAIVADGNGAIVRSTRQLAPGSSVVTRLHDGTFLSTVETTQPSESVTHGRRKPRKK